MAEFLAKTPYLWLLMLPGINVVSAAELAGEMGPLDHYANANAITGRAGLFPCRWQSDEVTTTGSLVRTTNRRLRASLMLIADNLTQHNHYYIGRAELWKKSHVDPRAIRVRVAKHFTRLLFALIAGRQELRHAAVVKRESVLQKLLKFHQGQRTTSDQLIANLEAAAEQLTPPAREREGELLCAALAERAGRRGPCLLADLLPIILRKYRVRITRRSSVSGETSRPASSTSSSLTSTTDATAIPSVSVADQIIPLPGELFETTHPITSPVGTTASNGSIPA